MRGARRLAALVAGASTATGIAVVTTQASAAAADLYRGRIAYISVVEGQHEIFTMRSDGTDRVRLTTDPAADTAPSWSADGARIAFSRATPNVDAPGEVMVMPSGGGQAVNLTNHPADDYQPVYSPDGRKIAFVSDRGGQRDLYVMNADGSDPVNVTDDADVEHGPRFSPDGSRLVYSAYRGYDAGTAVRLINPDGSGKVDVPSAEPGSVFTPDGRHLIYTVNDGDPRDGNHPENRRLVRLSLDTGAMENFGGDNGNRIEHPPTYSPDGQWSIHHSAAIYGGDVSIAIWNGERATGIEAGEGGMGGFAFSPTQPGPAQPPITPPTTPPVQPPGTHQEQPASEFDGGDGICGKAPPAHYRVIIGTPRDDVLRGSGGPDIIYGLSGDDTIDGRGGNDILCGGPGDDRIDGSSGRDRILGESGDDKVHAGSGADRVKGNSGHDSLKGAKGNDRISGGSGDDRLSGGRGKDRLDGGKGRDRGKDPDRNTRERSL